MTTVAWKDGRLAADCLARRGATVLPYRAQKLHIHNRVLYACVGAILICERVLDALLSGHDAHQIAREVKANSEDDFMVIEIREPTKIRVWEPGGSSSESSAIGAWGSGAHLALGAMLAGASAPQAIEIASSVDLYTGGGIDVLEFEYSAPMCLS